MIGNSFRDMVTSKRNRTLILTPSINTYTLYNQKGTFTFLNKSKDFGDIFKIEWNFQGYGKLWCYNLNYFDFLNQSDISKATGLELIHYYISSKDTLKDGLESYPISLRNMNWIKFLIKHEIIDDKIDQFLYSAYQHLRRNLEYHIMGNHLLENAFSLLFGAFYFRNSVFYNKAEKLLRRQLDEQILIDGAHFELSPMYHQILFCRLLDCFNLVQNNWDKFGLYEFLGKKAQLMLGWLSEVTFNNGKIPNVNDSIDGIAPSTNAILDYASRLNLLRKNVHLSASGYRMIRNTNYELFVDVGNIGPDYIPGHAHSDTFNFLLNINDKPVIVDTGISTYDKNERRQYERSTGAHNTVIINDKEQSEIWGSFRVGKRAKVIEIKEEYDSLSATHDGYSQFATYHNREWIHKEKGIVITDKILSNKKGHVAIAFLHFHPRIEFVYKENKIIGTSFCINLVGAEKIWIDEFELCEGFNKRTTSKRVIIQFAKKLETSITVK